MDPSNRQQRNDPSKLSTVCTHCKHLRPYNPLSSSGHCFDCELLMPSMSPAPAPSLKRPASDDSEDEPSSKRLASSSEHLSSSMTPVDEDEDSFVDAEEELESEISENEVMVEGEEGKEEDNNEETNGDDAEHEVQAKTDPDLFASAFGNNADSEEDDEVVEVSSIKATPTEKTAARNLDFDRSEHTKGCEETTRGPATPPDLPQFSGPAPIDPKLDRTKSLKVQERFHKRAKQLIPRLPLAEHRYWIGVLHMDVKAKSASQEKHFLWMKGNKFTTVGTVWHMYQQSAAADGFVLLLGLERVDFKDQAQELDHFNDKKIMFRAVSEKSPEAKGRQVTEGLIMTAEEVEVMLEKRRNLFKPKAEVEVIEIDD